MRIKTLGNLAICFITMLLFWGTALGQDFGQLLEAVDKLELSLKEVVQAERTARQQQFAVLEAKIDSLKTMAENSNQQASVEKATIAPESADWYLELKKEIQAISELLQMHTRKMAELEASLIAADGKSEPIAGEEYAASIESMIAELKKTMSASEAEKSVNRPEQSSANSSLPEINGFIDATNLSNFNVRRNETSVEQAELDIIKNFGDDLEVRADVEMLPDGTSKYNFDLEQAFFTYIIPGSQGMQITFGKFNSPIGFEGLDAPDRYQYSFATISEFGLPGNLVGLMLGYPLGKIGTFYALIANGWDVNVDNNSDKTFGSRVEIAPAEGFSFGLSALIGPEKDDNTSDKRMIFNVDFINEMWKRWVIGGELDWGRENNSAIDHNGDASWFGGLLATKFAFTEKLEATLRGDFFDDRGGSRTGFIQRLWGLTIAPRIKIAEGLHTTVEFRHIWSNNYSFTGRNDDFRSHYSHLAWQFVFNF